MEGRAGQRQQQRAHPLEGRRRAAALDHHRMAALAQGGVDLIAVAVPPRGDDLLGQLEETALEGLGKLLLLRAVQAAQRLEGQGALQGSPCGQSWRST